MFNSVFLACTGAACILEDNCLTEQSSGSIVDGGEAGNESVHQLTFVKVIPSHSLSWLRLDPSSYNDAHSVSLL